MGSQLRSLSMRVAKLERAARGDDEPAPDQRDLDLVGFYRFLYGDDLPEESVPAGVSLTQILGSLTGRVVGVAPDC